MAEILGVIASGMSVVSLGIQVAESIQKLRAFYTLIREVPTEILLLLDELETLSLILEDIDQSIQGNVFLDPRTKAAVLKSYRLCSNSGKALRSLAKEIEDGIGKGKRRGGFKMALKKDEIEETRKRLESSKATMLLANQCYNNAIQRQNWESHEQDMAEIKAAMGQIHGMRMIVSEYCAKVDEADDRQEEIINKRAEFQYGEPAAFEANSFIASRRFKNGPLTREKGMKTFLGIVDVVIFGRGRTTTTTISLNLPTWIYARRYQFCLTKSLQGWDQSFRSYRVVSFDASVFNYCMTGNVAGLQQLFESGQSSPFEVDPEGRTPLHYAALYSRPDVCRFLLDNGADANVRTSWYGKFEQSWYKRNHARYYNIGCTKTEERAGTYRGLPAYSTPLHLLVTVGHSLLAESRQGNSKHCVYSPPPLEDDFCDTIKALVVAGQGDSFYKDQFGLTVLGSYTGPSGMFRWLRQYEQAQISNLSTEEVYELVVSQFSTPQEDERIENIRQFVPEDKMNEGIAQTFTRNAHSLWPNLLCHATYLWSRYKAMRDGVYGKGFEKFILELINAGSELHVISSGYTILLVMVWGLSGWSQSCLRSALRSWLHILVEAGVDLIEFGRVENALHDENRVRWTFTADVERVPGAENYCHFQILDLRMGARPEDFYIEFEDLYVSAPLAAQFWEWVERPAIPDSEENMAIPGAWCDD